jgi:hypothetical protein
LRYDTVGLSRQSAQKFFALIHSTLP